MKTILTTIFFLINGIILSQTSDLLYVPNQNTFVGSIQYPKSIVGFYVGITYRTHHIQPFFYTTPLRFLNRVGLTLGTNKLSLMVGGFFDMANPEIKIKPDIWIKINPIRLLSNTETNFDFSLGLNYSTNLNYGLGISINY